MSPSDLLAHNDSGKLWPERARRQRACELNDAYRDALAVRALRIVRGEHPMGYKIGFTNRTIWPRYGVYAPIWGTVWNTTVSFCEMRGAIALEGICQPRIEPEIVFGLATTPASATLDDIFQSVDWLACGFEIVQSHCADWKFSAAETVADGGLHARLLVGRRIPVRSIADDAEGLDTRLAGSAVRLYRGNRLVEVGQGGNVLDGPLHALRHFVLEIRRCPGAPDLRAGDIVTTGTWTDAYPIAKGESWRADFDAPLEGLALELT